MTSDLAPIVFGLLSAASWGAGDFSGGLASKRSNVYSVIVTSQIIGAVLLFCSALVFAEKFPVIDHLVWGAIAGMAGAIGLVALYRALASGRMGVAAPISAVVTGAVPVFFGFFWQGLPKTLQLIGFGLALIGVWLISRSDDGAIKTSDLKLPIAAGLGFGVFLLLINRVSDTGILWPLVAARCGSLGLIAIYAATQNQLKVPAKNHLPLIALAGVMDTFGNAFYALAGQIGRLDVAAVLSSLYPASTVWLAWLILKERITRVQSIGIVATLAAIILITI
jgi:drug/metabolite transporter (DMT)-like permease